MTAVCTTYSMTRISKMKHYTVTAKANGSLICKSFSGFESIVNAINFFDQLRKTDGLEVLRLYQVDEDGNPELISIIRGGK